VKTGIVGAGISGLATAQAILARDSHAEVVIFEAGAHTGGKVLTENTPEGYLCEWGVNAFLDKEPRTLELCREIGLDPVSGDELPIPNTAEHFVKAGLNYNNESFGGRLRYQWRGKSLKSSFSESDLSIWNEPVGSLDLGLSWQLKKNVRIGLDARNLLDEEKIQTTDYSGQLMRINEQDRSVALTLRAKWS